MALGCGAYLAFALAQLPAATAYRWFGTDALVLSGISGTVWSGRAELGSIGNLPLRDVEWSVAPLALALGRFSVTLAARPADGLVTGSLSAGFWDVRLTDVRVTTSLDALGAVLSLQGARGTLSLDLAELSLRNGWPVAATGTVRIRELEVFPLGAPAGSALIPLGNYELSSFEVAELGLAALLRDDGGPLEIQGTVMLALQAPRTLAGAHPRFDGRVRERGDIPPELRTPLEFLTAAVDAEGWRTLNLDPWLRQL
ncbi:MAG TPA: type II secretion system protein N [Gammaproteobacteria bacterium]